ncbi:alpha/beta hydrolase [Pseudoxanthobacter sp.]|uniref:alpha/beta fold hydrolase n=1 Tax=Pseudoxanthobacter sp. TaxID=1925742 RepID=UPI002FDF5968
MAERVRVGDLELAFRVWGEGRTTVLFIHGNLASKDWLERAAPAIAPGIRVVAVDWRGCGDSDKPAPLPDFANYSIARHADDMLAALDALGIGFCHLATHSTGGIISTRMLLKAPQRFGRVFSLSPVSPLSIRFTPEMTAGFGLMKSSRDITRAVMATTMPRLFVPESLAPGKLAAFRADAADAAALFERIVDQTFAVSDGIWFGTPYGLTAEYELGELKARMGEIAHPHLVVWGEFDRIIQRADLEAMAAGMPDCQFVVAPGAGHSLSLERPEMYAGFFNAWFGGLTA